MKISITNLLNEIVLQNQSVGLFAKLNLLQQSPNSSFIGNVDNIINYFLSGENIKKIDKLIDLWKIKNSTELVHPSLLFLRKLSVFAQIEKDSSQEDAVDKFNFDNALENQEYGFFEQAALGQMYYQILNELEDLQEKCFAEQNNEVEELFESFGYISPRYLGAYTSLVNFVVNIIFCSDEEKIYDEILDEQGGIISPVTKLEYIIQKAAEEFPNLAENFNVIFSQVFFLVKKLKDIYNSQINNSEQYNVALMVSLLSLAGKFAVYHLSYHTRISIELVKQYIDLSDVSVIDKLCLNELREVLVQMNSVCEKSCFTWGICSIIEKLGLEIEHFEDSVFKLYQLLHLEIVKIFNVEKHPNSDKLSLCEISNGHKVVCGAGNVSHIMKNNLCTIYAPLNSYLPNNLLMQPREIRGVLSKGMLCALDELCANGLGVHENDGIAELSCAADEAIVSQANLGLIVNLFNWHLVVELSVTPNLGYLLGEHNLFIQLKKFLTLSSDLNDQSEYVEDESKINKIDLANDIFSFEHEVVVAEDVKDLISNVFCISLDAKNLNFERYQLEYLSMIDSEFDYKNSNKIEILLKYFHALYGVYLHVIKADNVKRKIVFKKAMKSRQVSIWPNKKMINTYVEDLIAVDENNEILFIPGVVDLSQSREIIENETSQQFIIVGIIFSVDKKNPLQNGYLGQLNLSRREKLQNDMVYFYQRQVCFDFIAILQNKVLSQLTEGEIKLFALHKGDQQFKTIEMRLYDLLVLFKADAKILFNLIAKKNEILAMQNSETEQEDWKIFAQMVQFSNSEEDLKECQNLIVKFIEYIEQEFIETACQTLSFKIIDKSDDKFFKELPVYKISVPVERQDLIGSIDLVGDFCKLLNAAEQINIVNDLNFNYFEKFQDNENLNLANLRFMQEKQNIFQYTDNPIAVSFLMQDEELAVQKLHVGENKIRQNFYKVCQRLSNIGYGEMYNFSFIEEKKLDLIDKQYLVHLSSPINQNLNVLRTNLICGLLGNYIEIIKKQETATIFESGPIFNKYNIFHHCISGLRGGRKIPKNIYQNIDQSINYFDYFDVKADVLNLLFEYKIKEDDLQFIALDQFYDKDNFQYKDYFSSLKKEKLLIDGVLDKELHYDLFHPLKTAMIFYKNSSMKEPVFLGYCGELSLILLQKFGLIDQGHEKIAAWVVFKNILDDMKLSIENSLKNIEIFTSNYPAVSRDFALVFDENITIAQIKQVIFTLKEQDNDLKNLFHDLRFFDIFQNDELKNRKKKSVGFSFKLCSKLKTLNDKEIEMQVNKILQILKQKLGGVFAFDLTDDI